MQVRLVQDSHLVMLGVTIIIIMMSSMELGVGMVCSGAAIFGRRRELI